MGLGDIELAAASNGDDIPRNEKATMLDDHPVYIEHG